MGTFRSVFQTTGIVTRKSQRKVGKNKDRDWYQVNVGYMGGNIQFTVDFEQFQTVHEGSTYQFTGELVGSGQYGDPRCNVKTVKEVAADSEANNRTKAA